MCIQQRYGLFAQVRFLFLGLEILERIVPRASEDQVQRAIKLLLNSGQIEAAKSIQQSENLAAQIEFFLVDTALSIVHRCGSNGQQWSFLYR